MSAYTRPCTASVCPLSHAFWTNGEVATLNTCKELGQPGAQWVRGEPPGTAAAAPAAAPPPRPRPRPPALAAPVWAGGASKGVRGGRERAERNRKEKGGDGGGREARTRRTPLHLSEAGGAIKC